MRNWFKAIVMSVVLFGCTSTEHNVEVDYPLPTPIKVSEVKWLVVTKDTIASQPDNVVIIGLTWKDSLKHRQYMESLLDYIKKQQIIICNHQKCE